MENIEKVAIKKVIDDAYIKGIHGNQDEKIVKSGFHRDFAMLVKENGNIKKVTVDLWLANIKKDKAKNPDRYNVETTCNYELIDVTENAAIAKLQVYKDSKHFSTDYMLLYKYKDGWKIVSKIFRMW
ncbi:MAG: nuclear transport factor 2 family protein [Calditrichales bacterium]|nr:nuclear transport factor 2 family protein [Calditrichales bacterium]